MKDTNIAVVAANTKTLIYSKDTKQLFSKEKQALFESISKRVPTQPKYYKAQKDLIIRKTKECFETTPEMPLKKVIIDIMTPLPDFLPADNLIKVVGYIVKTWEKELAKNLAATK